jgi:dTDP-4-amino-4,6-dideoxygalactose transaminase
VTRTLTATASAVGFVDFSPPDIGQAEMDEVLATLRSGWLSTGPRVARFEEAFAAYAEAPFAVAVNSCTAALHVSLLTAGIGPGDEVVTTPLTFCATANVIVHTGATPVFADADPTSFNLTPAAASHALTPRTRALLPVHFAGRPVDVAGFRTLASRHELVLIADAAHAVEGRSAGRAVGQTADFTCFSFYATKNLTTGEGGMVTTTSAERAERVRVAALHGMTRSAWDRYGRARPASYDVVLPGFKYNMTDLQAAIGLHQLASLERRLERRVAIWRRYDEALAPLPLVRPAPVAAGDRHARHLYTILVDERAGAPPRDELQMALHGRGVATSIHFKPLHLHPFYAERFGLRRGMFPVAERIGDTTLSLPLSPSMSDAAVDRVIEALHDCLLAR